jgi:broad specificity phosphatase PhoE
MDMIIVRHGEPLTHGPETPSDPPLSPRGEEQAASVCASLASEGITHLFSSGMRRADATGAPLAKHSGLALHKLEGIGEIDRFGGHYVHVETIRERGPDDWRRFMADPIGYYGVDSTMFTTAVLDGFRTIVNGGSDARVAVFTHGFPINILLSHVLGLDSIVRFIPYHASITRLTGPSLDRLTVVSVNETGHLPEALK